MYSNWSVIQGLVDRSVEDNTKPIWGRYVQHIFEQKDSAGSYSSKERGMVGMHWLNTTGGDLDNTWTTGDFTLIENGFQAFWTALGTDISNEVRLVEHRWYQFGPGAAPPNPPVRITSITAVPGTGTNIMAHQLAQTLTLRTPLRRHWGRMYMPMNPTAARWQAGGQFINASVDALASAGSTYLKSGNANGITPVIYDRNRKSCLGITAVEADSIPDVIRRRRPRDTRYRAILTA